MREVIPWLFEEDAADSIFCEVDRIFHRIIDHEGDTDRFTGIRLWSAFIAEVVHVVDALLSDKRKMGLYPVLSS